MTSHYLTNITPDSLTGILFAFEGIKDSIVLLNGPTGCKFYHSATSDHQTLRQLEFDPLNYPELWYFGQPRIPCTYLDKKDYVYGSEEKLTEALRFLKKNMHFQMVVIVNSPGEALIGDDIQRIVKNEMKDFPVVTVETPGYSSYIWEGYEQACMALISQLLPTKRPPVRKDKKRKTVNLLGLSIFHRYYEGDKKEWTRLLKLCGIEVNCALCCECTLEEIQRLPQADLNILLDPVYGRKTARLLEERYGMPYVGLTGVPIGFSATEKLMKLVAEKLECDTEAFVVESEKARARAYIHLSRLNSLTGLPKGVKFAVHGTTSRCYGYTEFLVRYFGMVAETICCLGEDDISLKLRENLEKMAMEGAMDKDIMDTKAAMIFADGNIIARLKVKKHSFCGIETGLPSIGYNDVIPKTHMGLYGSLFLCEQVINGLLF